MKIKERRSCLNCRRSEARFAALEATVARLQEQLAAARKDSATSSKTLPFDVVKSPKPPPPDGEARHKIGGQPEHPKHERDRFPRHQQRVFRSSYRPLSPVRPWVGTYPFQGVARLLRDADRDLATGLTISDFCRKDGIAETTYYRWRQRSELGQVDADRRCRELELQVDCLKRLVAELLLDNKWPGSGVKRRTGQRMIV